MPDLTTAIRAAVEAKCVDTAAKASIAAGKTMPVFDALKHENTERWVTGIKHHTGFSPDNRPQFTSDHSIGAMHWQDKAGVMQPVQTDWAAGADGWSDRNETSQARILVGPKGTRRVYPDQLADAYIEFAPPEYYDGEKWQPLEVPEQQSAKAVTAEVATWTADHWRVEVVNTGSQSKLSYVMLDERAPSRVRWPYTTYACSLDDAGNLTDGKGTVVATVYQGRAEDADGNEVGVKTLMDKEAVEYQVDAGKVAWPVALDPTVDYSVGTNAKDICYSGWTNWGDTGSVSGITTNYIGNSSNADKRACSNLFTGVTIPAGAQVDVSYQSFYGVSGTLDTANGLVYADDTATPAAPTTGAEFSGKTSTSATVAWLSIGHWSAGTWYPTPSLNSILTELLASYDYSSGASMQFIVRDNGSTQFRTRNGASHDSDSSHGAKLHIEYTAAATGFKHYLSLLGVGR